MLLTAAAGMKGAKYLDLQRLNSFIIHYKLVQLNGMLVLQSIVGRQVLPPSYFNHLSPSCSHLFSIEKNWCKHEKLIFVPF